MTGGYTYILLCADGSYYVGSTSGEVENRVVEHNEGKFDGYTARRLPVTLAFSEFFNDLRQAHDFERQIKGWSRAKKEALIRGDWKGVSAGARRRAGKLKPSSS